MDQEKFDARIKEAKDVLLKLWDEIMLNGGTVEQEQIIDGLVFTFEEKGYPHEEG